MRMASYVIGKIVDNKVYVEFEQYKKHVDELLRELNEKEIYISKLKVELSERKICKPKECYTTPIDISSMLVKVYQNNDLREIAEHLFVHCNNSK